MGKADTIVIGLPLYWHSICGSVCNAPARFYDRVQNGVYSGEAVRHILDSIGDFFYAHLQEAPWPQS